MKFPKIRLPSREKIEENVQETAIVGGFLMLAKGLYSIFPPVMWIICGVLLMLLGIPWRKIRHRKG